MMYYFRIFSENSFHSYRPVSVVCVPHVTRFVRPSSPRSQVPRSRDMCSLTVIPLIKNYLDYPEIGRINRVENFENLNPPGEIWVGFVANLVCSHAINDFSSF